jgi:hypothetical protein
VTYASFNPAQREAIAQHVRAKIVHDLGAGDLILSRELLDLGARRVYAIDKEDKPSIKPWPRGLHYKQEYFHNLSQTKMDTIFLSWPINHETNLVPLIRGAGTLIYLGCNTGGTACGTPGLFLAMVSRKLLAYVPDPRNSLIIVGESLRAPREPTGEELAGMTMYDRMWSFDAAESACPMV